MISFIIVLFGLTVVRLDTFERYIQSNTDLAKAITNLSIKFEERESMIDNLIKENGKLENESEDLRKLLNRQKIQIDNAYYGYHRDSVVCSGNSMVQSYFRSLCNQKDKCIIEKIGDVSVDRFCDNLPNKDNLILYISYRCISELTGKQSSAQQPEARHGKPIYLACN